MADESSSTASEGTLRTEPDHAVSDWTVRKVLEWSTSFLKRSGSESPRLDAEILLANARGCERIQLYARYDELLTDNERSAMRGLVQRRAAAEPVAYLVGHREFFGLDFEVTADTFIPRPDTETLVVAAIDRIRQGGFRSALDLCTGSGCVSVAIASQCPDVRFVATDINSDTLAVARRNAARHGVEQLIDFRHGDLFEPIAAGEKFDIIVSNPPYIGTDEAESLPSDVLLHEPRAALFSGNDGLDVIRRLVNNAPEHLTDRGWMLMELDPNQAAPVRDLMHQRGTFDEPVMHQDLAREIRVIGASMTPQSNS